MKSKLLALLLVANVLTCPARCLPCDSNDAVAKVTSTPASCCNHCEPIPVSDMPSPGGEECDCQGCICEGAVSEPDAEVSESNLCVWLVGHLLRVDDLSVATSESRPSYADPASWPPLRGRDVRLAHQSWLI